MPGVLVRVFLVMRSGLCPSLVPFGIWWLQGTFAFGEDLAMAQGIDA